MPIRLLHLLLPAVLGGDISESYSNSLLTRAVEGLQSFLCFGDQVRVVAESFVRAACVEFAIGFDIQPAETCLRS